MKNGRGSGQPLLEDPAFDRARQLASVVMDDFWRHRGCEPNRLPLADMENTTMPSVAARLADRWPPLPQAPTAAPAKGPWACPLRKV